MSGSAIEQRLNVRIFGIRHHGPGSARSLLVALEEFAPDSILVEGPPDADELVGLVADAELRPPVALLVHVADEPRRGSFFPFAQFSPEWNALTYAATKGVPARFCDLPCQHSLALEAGAGDADAGEAEERTTPTTTPNESTPPRALDPLDELARAAGCEDGEAYWDGHVEGRFGASASVFESIRAVMSELRAHVGSNSTQESRREAWMRREIRAELKQGRQRVAVVCGAWHAPALESYDRRGGAKDDDALLKGLPKVKTAAAWVPWTFERLASESGYGAGVRSPEWYQLLWELAASPGAASPATIWLTRVARLLRDRDIDSSTASVVEAVRLAETLAVLRERALPGLVELEESALGVLCGGNAVPMGLVRSRLVIGSRLGAVPSTAPLLPIQRDLASEQKRLRLTVAAVEKDIELDLRKEFDLDRSRLLRRLAILDVPWGKLVSGRRSRGTFRETWRLVWKPEFVVGLVDAARLGNTVVDAAEAKAASVASRAGSLRELVEELDAAMLAELPAAVGAILVSLDDRSAAVGDVPELMDALPPLAQLARYGNVRETDVAAVGMVLDRLLARVLAGLGGACASLDDDAARAMSGRIGAVHDAVQLIDRAHTREEWIGALIALSERGALHGILNGRITKLMLTSNAWDRSEVATRLGLALSVGNPAAHAAAFVEGLLAGAGAILAHDDDLSGAIDAWLCELAPARFDEVLPLLRRTFATFEIGERRRIGETLLTERVGIRPTSSGDHADIDVERAREALPRLAQILGVST